MLAELINAQHGLGYLLMTSQRRRLSKHHPDSDHHRPARLRNRSAAVLVPARSVSYRTVECADRAAERGRLQNVTKRGGAVMATASRRVAGQRAGSRWAVGCGRPGG
jgi:hypothetical protein